MIYSKFLFFTFHVSLWVRGVGVVRHTIFQAILYILVVFVRWQDTV